MNYSKISFSYPSGIPLGVSSEIHAEVLARISPGVPIVVSIRVTLGIHQRVHLEIVSEFPQKFKNKSFSEYSYNIPKEIPSVPVAILPWEGLHWETTTLKEGTPRNIPKETRRGIT